MSDTDTDTEAEAATEPQITPGTEEEQRARVVRIALEWIGTPYIHAGQIKGLGGGCDCGTFLIGVYSEAELIKWFKPERYTADFMLHKAHPIYRNLVTARARQITEEEAKPGDLVLYRVGYQFAHGAIIIEPGWDRMVHSYKPAGHVTGDHGLGGSWGKRPKEFFSYWGQ